MAWFNLLKKIKTVSPQDGYDLWAAHYETDHNLMQLLDAELVAKCLLKLDLEGKTILDFGCGTGRHWPTMFKHHPRRLIGVDLSKKMLGQLEEKYSDCDVFQVKDHLLPKIEEQSIDLLFSTLTIGHLPSLLPYFEEWNRVLKGFGHILITGNHPKALKMGVKRSFQHRGQTIHIRNEHHSLHELQQLAGGLGWKVEYLEEVSINESHKSFFEAKGALDSFETIKNKEVLYGVILRKG